MFLSGEMMAAGNFFKNDLPRGYGPNSYDLRIGSGRLIRPQKEFVDLTRELPEDTYEDLIPLMRTRGGKEYDVFRLFKNNSFIATSIETVSIPQGYVGICSPRSNLGYVLDFQHSLLVDTGFEGVLTARITSPFHTVDIPVKMRFLQVLIAKSEDVDEFYTERALSKNLNQTSKKKIKYKVDKEFIF